MNREECKMSRLLQMYACQNKTGKLFVSLKTLSLLTYVDMPLKKVQDAGIMILPLNIKLEEGYKNVEHLKIIFTQLMLP